MTRTEEKIGLAKELGMYETAKRLEETEKIKKEFEELTAMKFKIITGQEIEKKLQFQYLDLSWKERLFLIGIWTSEFVSILGARHSKINSSVECLCFLLSIILGMASLFSIKIILENWNLTDIRNKKLENWNDDMPYGAFLAVKEAKEKGFSDFEIFYPVKNQERERLKADPIIVGYRPGSKIMVEIFSWDDRKIYE